MFEMGFIAVRLPLSLDSAEVDLADKKAGSRYVYEPTSLLQDDFQPEPEVGQSVARTKCLFSHGNRPTSCPAVRASASIIQGLPPISAGFSQS